MLAVRNKDLIRHRVGVLSCHKLLICISVSLDSFVREAMGMTSRSITKDTNGVYELHLHLDLIVLAISTAQADFYYKMVHVPSMRRLEPKSSLVCYIGWVWCARVTDIGLLMA